MGRALIRVADVDGTRVHPLGALMRRFVVDWLDRADPAVPPEIMAPDYTIEIAGVTMTGRDAYLEATTGQLARFPGLTVTVHDVLYGDDLAALRFTEHGASERGGAAAWRGIGLFRVADGVLVHNACEEDYLGRRRQLVRGVTDPVDPPLVAPWTTPPADPDPAAETAVRDWLANGGPRGDEPGIVFDDGTPGVLLDAVTCDVGPVLVAGGRVAFHVVQHGRHAGTPVDLGVAGIVTVAPDGALTGHVVRDRLGLHRAVSR